jgi:hypothetical protein
MLNYHNLYPQLTVKPRVDGRQQVSSRLQGAAECPAALGATLPARNGHRNITGAESSNTGDVWEALAAINLPNRGWF